VTGQYPLGITHYELREELGEPHFGQVEGDQFWVEDLVDSHPDWVVHARFFVGTGGMRLIGLNLSPKSLLPWPPRPLTSEVARKIQIDSLYRLAAQSQAGAEHFGIWFDVDLDDFHGRRRPGRSGRPDVWYAKVADRYVHLLGISNTPTKTLAEEMYISASSARDVLSEARRRGLLTRPPVTGRPGGELTEKAKRVVQDEDGE
jgi:hypothetical protein